MKPVAHVSNRDFGLYIHFPYCLRVCPYCDFNVYAGPFNGQKYCDAVIREIDSRQSQYSGFGQLRSIYFGGGTPSLWAAKHIQQVIQHAQACFGIQQSAEITVECNPENLECDYLEELESAGVNRISLGSQSMVNSELIQLGRLHQAEQTVIAIENIKRLKLDVSVDVMFGMPGQLIEDVVRSLELLVALPIDHLSAYGLTIEPNTNFDRRRIRGTFHPMSSDEQAKRMVALWRYLEEQGFDHYEVSAFSRKGKRAIHNSLYWMNSPYLGVGAGAHSYLPSQSEQAATRTETIRNPVTYNNSNMPAFEMEEQLSAWEELIEFLMVRSRVSWGFSYSELPEISKVEPKAFKVQLQNCIDELSSEGLVVSDDIQVYPTTRGFQFADTVAQKLVNTLSELVHY
ncbi:MAG: radical SAM family heme chaperone HemW [Myxococcota bacterium]|nr:radical SAM family heme chaperone HemW [Myxococcota bacterium]